MTEFIERACLSRVSLSNVVGAHREALQQFLISSAAAADGVEDMTRNQKRPDPTPTVSTSSSAVVSVFYTETGDKLSSSVDKVLSLLLSSSDQDITTSSISDRKLKPNFPFGIIGLLSIVSPCVSLLVDPVSKTSTNTTSSTIPSPQPLHPSAIQCLQFLRAVAIHEDAFYALWDASLTKTTTTTTSATTREEMGKICPQQQRQKQQPKNDTDLLDKTLPLESICISTIFSVLPKVAHYLISIHGYARQDIISSGIVAFMGRMAHFFGSSILQTNTTTSTHTTTLLTPAHCQFVQLCFLSGQYQLAITFASSLTASLVQQRSKKPNGNDHINAKDIPLSPPLLIPLTVGHYLRYFYTLGNIYMLHDPRKYYKKALDMWNICITTPTTSSSALSSSSTPFYQKQPSATTPISSDVTSNKASSAIHPLQIAARKKHLLVSCLVACSHTSVFTTPTMTHDSYLYYYLPPMPLRKTLRTKGTDQTHCDMRSSSNSSSRGLSIPETKDSYYTMSTYTNIEEDVPRNVPGQKQYYNSIMESVTKAPSPQQPNWDSTNLSQSPTSWPWSLPLYTSTCVYNAFFLDPSVHYNYYKQQQSATTTTTDGSSTNVQQQQQQGSVKPMLQELEQYNSLIAAYWFGDTSSFQKISGALKDLFLFDGTWDLIVQLKESFTFRMIYTLANVYEAMPISMLVDYITLFDASTTADTLWKVLEKARECNTDFTFDIDQQHGFVHFFHVVKEPQDSSSSSENDAFLGEQMAAYVSLTERIKELDVSLATSKKYQAVARSKELTAGKKQGTAASGTTTMPKTSAAAGGSTSGSADRITWV